MTIGPESQLGGQVVSDIASATKNIYPIFQSMQIMRIPKYASIQNTKYAKEVGRVLLSHPPSCNKLGESPPMQY